MSKSIKSIIDRDAQYQKNCVSKWKRLLVAENAPAIKDRHVLETTAVLLENQSRFLKEDAAANNSSIWGSNAAYGGAIATGDSYAKGDNRLPKILLPMIRRTFPELISNEVVGVQPMQGPISLAFAIRYRYAEGPLHEARAAGTITNPPTTGLHYGVNTKRKAPAYGVEPTGWTGAQQPENQTFGNPPGVTDMTQLDSTVSGAGTEMGYNYLDTSFTGRRNRLFNRSLNPQTGAPWTDADIINTWNDAFGAADEVRSVEALEDKALPNSGDANQAAAARLLTVTSIAGGKFSFSDQDLGVAALMGDYEATGRIPKTKFTFEKKAVEAGTRRIGTSWTLELEQDIKNMNGIDIENEVTSMMSYELQAEIDREMIVRMLYAALSANEYSYWDGSKADARWMAERDRAFYQFIIQMSNRMAVRNRRGPANFIIATPDVCSLLETLPQYALMEVNGNINTNNVGVAKVGTIGGGRFTVYRDTRTPVQNNAWVNNQWDAQGQYSFDDGRQGLPDFALLGYKGSEFWDAGILFCPYIPIMLQRVVDPTSFEPNVGLMTRYGVVDNIFGANLYYHVILIDTLSNTLPPEASPANNWPGSYRASKVTIGAEGEDVTPYTTTMVDGAATLGSEPVVGGYPVQVTNTAANPVVTTDANA